MTFRVIDIETVPLAASMAAPYPEADRQPPANYKNPDAIEGWRAKDRLAWAEQRAKECSLNPRLGRVLAIGMATPADEGVYYAQGEELERAVIRAFWDELMDEGVYYAQDMATPAQDGMPTKAITWNGAWDLRFLVVRSLILGLTIPVDARIVRDWAKPYNTEWHTDVKRVFVGDGIIKGEGLDEWARVFGLPGKAEGWTGASVYPAYLDGRHQDIQDYCLADVVATRSLYQIVAPIVED